jgi:hypothetical protein
MATDTVDLTENRQSEILIIAWVMTGAALSTVATKLFTRLRIIRVIGWDDFFIVLSTVGCTMTELPMEQKTEYPHRY